MLCASLVSGSKLELISCVYMCGGSSAFASLLHCVCSGSLYAHPVSGRHDVQASILILSPTKYHTAPLMIPAALFLEAALPTSPCWTGAERGQKDRVLQRRSKRSLVRVFFGM